jgi:hypothetical protein
VSAGEPSGEIMILKDREKFNRKGRKERKGFLNHLSEFREAGLVPAHESSGEKLAKLL